MTEEPEQNKLNWWVDTGLLFVAPVVTLLAAALHASEEILTFSATGVPLPLALIVGFRVARRAVKPLPAVILLGLAMACVTYVLMCVLSMFGCALGGGGFDLR